MRRKINKAKIKAIGVLCTKLFAFMYALLLAYGQIAWIREKSIFVQIIPLLIALVICALCEE